MKPYKLMCSIFGHTSDVKYLCATRENGGFASVSRDLSAKIWMGHNSSYTETKSITYHKKYVNSLAIVYTLKKFPDGLILTGSNDKTISIHCIVSNKLVGVLDEHEGAVCNLFFDNVSGNNILYSSSFDSTVKIWNLNDFNSEAPLKSLLTIKGHDMTVWSVVCIEKKSILLTGSADKTIKHWQLDSSNTSAELGCKYLGHTDCVRALTLNNLNSREFFSCSNDGSVIQWQLLNPNPLRVFQITNSFLYSVNMVYSERNAPDEYVFITSGEDRTLRIHSTLKANSGFDSSACIQSLALPCQTLWYTMCLPNETIAVACSDGSIRLFTNHEKLMANENEQAEYEQELSRFAIPIKSDETMSQIDPSKLPGPEALTQMGHKDGQTLIIKSCNEVEVYQWSGSDNKWIKIGVAVGTSTGTSQKTSYLGKEYDYVFDIDIDDSGVKLKLPYDLSDDPYMAAQKFIDRHELNQMFLDEIAQFIIKNTANKTSTQHSVSCDPFTGGNAYIAGSSNLQSYKSSNQTDPFTGTSSYSVGNKKEQNEVQTKPNEFFPHLDFILFDQLNLDLILKKINEIQSSFIDETENKFISDKHNLAVIENLIKSYKNKNITIELHDQFELLFEMINNWPIDSVFPLLDLARILSLDKIFVCYITRFHNSENHINKQSQHSSNIYFDIITKFLTGDKIVNSMLVAKIFCNIFNSLNNVKDPSIQQLLAYMLYERSFIFYKLCPFLVNTNKSFHIAFSTLILNYIVLVEKLIYYNEKFSVEVVNDIYLDIIHYFNNKEMNNNFLKMDQEAIFRILVSIGTLLTKTSSQKDDDYLKTIYKSLEQSISIIQIIVSNPSEYTDKVIKSANNVLKMV